MNVFFFIAAGRGAGAAEQGHRHIEGKVHDVRTISFSEDADTTPTNLAAIRSAVIDVLRRAGYRFIPDLRRTAPSRLP
ncbi:hypothetical protein [Frankia sp. CiP3]|uniref:hypothetical protein n=1 Tax=Frankia sp. CiP3 TaxID=2880971 RepID=UPI001EF542C0|nr:hypothetical protein [Frankia sp. CiP3]